VTDGNLFPKFLAATVSAVASAYKALSPATAASTAVVEELAWLVPGSIPLYTDTAALPAPGAGAVWKYKGIYREADAQVGQWSDVVSVAVAG